MEDDETKISIRRSFASNAYTNYTIDFFGTRIFTTVTTSASTVESWLSQLYSFHRDRLSQLVVGLDTEWYRFPPQNVAVLQLCVGRRCLIFQLCRAGYVPEALADFLANSNFRFVGVGIDQDAKKLEEGYGLGIKRPVDLAPLAARKYNSEELKRAGLKRLTSLVLGRDVEKCKRITLSNWAVDRLRHEQVQYASLDAYLSFQIGWKLIFKD